MRGRFFLAAALTSAALTVPLPVLGALVPDKQISSVEERRVLVSVEAEYDKLATREAELDKREMELKTLQREVDKKLASMQSLRQELIKLLERKKSEEGERLSELSAIYEKMDPAKSAMLIKGLDQQMAIDLLINIKKKVAGRILNNLDRETATRLSKGFGEIPLKN